jgi:drug/metabolite transporter (DMT)-like permease
MQAPTGLLNDAAGIDASNVQPLSPLYGTLVRMVAGTVLLVGYGVLVGKFMTTVGKLKDRKALGQTTAGAFFGPFIGVTLSLAAVAWTNTAVAATVMAISPVLVIPIVRVVYRHKVTLRAVVGALVAVAGVGVLTFRQQIVVLISGG